MVGSERSQLPDAPAPGLFQVISLSGMDSSGNNGQQHIREYKRRRPHKKSRGGCSACKQRRVKCDQAMPTCLRCRRNQRTCVYEHSVDVGNAAESSTSTSGDSGDPKRSSPAIRLASSSSTTVASASSMSMPSGHGYTQRCAGAQIAAREGAYSDSRIPGYRTLSDDHGRVVPGHLVPMAMASSSRPSFRTLRVSNFPSDGPDVGTAAALLLHHVRTTRQQVYDLPDFSGGMGALDVIYPHLHHTMLAISASHLCHWAPGSMENHIARHYQQSLALKYYQEALSTPFDVLGQTGVDALLLTATLVNLLTFILPTDDSDAVMVWHDGIVDQNGNPGTPWLGRSPCADPDPDPRRSWVFSPSPNRLSWLAILMGLASLLGATTAWREKSNLAPMYASADDERRILTGNWQSVSRVPQAWLDLFGIDRRLTPRHVRKTPDRTESHSAPLSVKATLEQRQAPQQQQKLTEREALDGRRSPGGASRGFSSNVRGGRSVSVVSNTSNTSNTSSTSSGSSSHSGSSGAETSLPTMSEADRLYRTPLRIVAEVWHMPANGRTFISYFQFPMQIDADFRHRLNERDEKTLWLFGMWMGLLCRFNVWWVRRRARCDFRAIRLWLHLVGVHRRPGSEGHLWREVLKDLDGTWGYQFDTDEVMQRVIVELEQQRARG